MAVGSFFATIVIGDLIVKEVNETLGTNYGRIWSLSGNKIWEEHRKLFPSDPKRAMLVAALTASFGLFIAVGLLTR